MRFYLKSISKVTFARFLKVEHKSSMPKKGNKKVSINNSVLQDASSPVSRMEASPIILSKNGDVLIKILATPGAKCSQVSGFSAEGVGVQIGAPPVNAEANTELVKFFAKVLGVRKSDVALEKGMKSREKYLSVQSSSGATVDSVVEKLKTAIENG